MRTILQKIIGNLFPTHCIVCEARGPDLCQKCLHGFTVHKPPSYEWIVSIWDYHDPCVEKIIRHIKNYPNKRLVRSIINQTVSADIIIPIPIGNYRFRERGYNQAELLALELGKKSAIPVETNILFKKKQTHKQGTTKSRDERFVNIKDSFGIKNPKFVHDKNIVLVDDVTTTGATLFEARKTLLEAGAKTVTAFTIAN